jgi:glycosyltransferase involved in cell wall biosynthesis
VTELGIPRERIRVQHNGVDGERFRIRDRSAARQRLGVAEDRQLVTFVGNLVPEKGVDVLIDAMGALEGAGTENLELALVGAGGMAEALRQRAGALGIGPRVRFCGRRPHEEIADWITAADLFCLPSLREGCPNVVLEALASGRPVVASRVGGVPELIREETGVLVPARDAPALAEGIRTALSRTWDPGVLRGSVPYLSWDQFGRTLYQTLEEAIQEHRGTTAVAPRERVAA